MEEIKRVSSRNLTCFPDSEVDPLVVCSERGGLLVPPGAVHQNVLKSCLQNISEQHCALYLRVPGRTAPPILSYLLPGFRDKSCFLT